MRSSPGRSDHSITQPEATVRLSVQEAARALGVTVEAVRGRMHRGKYVKEKTDDGRVFVRLTPEQLAGVHERSDAPLSVHTPHVHDQMALVEELRDQNAFLRQELEARAEEIHRRDTIIMRLSQSLQALEEAPQPSSTKEEADESLLQAEDAAQESQGEPASARRRSWLVRFFYGP